MENFNYSKRRYALERYIFGMLVSWCPTDLQKEPARVLHVKPGYNIGWDVKGARHKMGIPCSNACHAEVKMHVPRLDGSC